MVVHRFAIEDGRRKKLNCIAARRREQGPSPTCIVQGSGIDGP